MNREKNSQFAGSESDLETMLSIGRLKAVAKGLVKLNCCANSDAEVPEKNVPAKYVIAKGSVKSSTTIRYAAIMLMAVLRNSTEQNRATVPVVKQTVTTIAK